MRRALLLVAAAALATAPAVAHASETGPIRIGTDKCYVVVNPPVNVGTQPPYVTWEQTELAPFWVVCPLV